MVFDMALGLVLSQHIQFINNRLRLEFLAADRRVVNVIGSVLYFLKHVEKIEEDYLLVITHINRDWEGQDKIYGNDPKYQVSPWASVHMYNPSCGIDCVSTTLLLNTKGLIEFVEKHNPYGDSKHFSIVTNYPGQPGLIHCQCKPMAHNAFIQGKSHYEKNKTL